MKEGAPNPAQKQEKRSGILEAGVVAAALLGMNCEEAKALEIEPHTSWTVGIQKLQRAVMYEKNESAAVFVRFNDKSEAWPMTVEGSAQETRYDSKKEVNFIFNESKGRGIESYCQIHTHPHQTFKPPFGNTLEFLYTPPSSRDILNDNQTAKGLEKTYQAYQIPVKKIVSAVADTSGIWYYKGAQESQFSPEQERAWLKEYQNFGVATLKPNFDFKVEYPKLQQSYKNIISGDIRFVPYEKIKSEPPCAGVDYKAK